MIKKTAQVLLSYAIGILVSMFLTIPLSPMFGFSPTLFSVITGLISISFLYTKIWKLGKYDTLKKENALYKPLIYISANVFITIVVELVVVLYSPAQTVDISMLIGSIWFYPFTGFFTNENFVPVSIAITVFLVLISILAYFAGTKGFSLTDKILTARKLRRDKKAEKHFEEIEKIKEEYRNKK